MHKFNIIVLVLILNGCATPATIISTAEPLPQEIPNMKSISFSQGRDVIWNDLLSMFASSDFHVDKISLKDYMVKFRYIGQPDEYIDCGSKKVSTEDNSISVINTKKNYSYRAYQYIHLETYSIVNNFTGYVTFLVTGDDASSRVITQFDLVLETEENRTTTRGKAYNTSQQEKLTLNPYKPTYSNLFKTNCLTTGKLENQVFKTLSQLQNSQAVYRMDN